MVDMITKDNDNDDIKTRLDTLIAILLNPTSLQEATTKQKIAFLVRLKFDNGAISKILDTSLGLVAKERSLLKKSEKHE